MTKPLLYTSFGLSAILLWASSMSFLAYLRGIPSMHAVPILLFGAAIPGLFSQLLRQKLEYPKPLGKWIGVSLALALHQYALVLSPRYMDPALAEMMSYFWPLIVLILQGLLPKERFYIRFLLPTLLGGGSIIFAFLDRIDSVSASWACFLPFGAACLWAGYVLLSRHDKGVAADQIGWYYFLAFVCTLPGGWLTAETIPLSDYLVLLAFGIGILGFSLIFWERGVKQGNLRLLSIASCAAPLLSVSLLVFLGFAFFSWNLLYAVLLFTIAIWLCQYFCSTVSRDFF